MGIIIFQYLMKTLTIIPSRLSATRLPGKPLLKINDISIISLVFKRAQEANIGNVVVAAEDQFKIEQAVQEFAFKYRGFSLQQEWHRKFVTDRVEGTESDLTGFYIQSGYFFHNLFDAFPAPLELAARYAYVSEPNKSMRSIYNEREEFTLGANWFFAGHSNKITVDFSHLTLDDGLMMTNHSENRFRIQWDVSF